jgi:hypothetical protein
MSEANLDRVREDLAVMRQAIGFRPPFERGHVWVSLALAAVGGLVAALTAFTNVAAVPVTQGSAAQLTYIALLVVPVLLVFTGMAVVARRRRTLAPFLWREARQSAVAAAVAVPLYLSFLVWAVWQGVSPGAFTAATLFLAGLFSLIGALFDPSRRYVLGWAASTMLAGVCSVVGTYGNAGIIVGGWLLLGGLSTAGILLWQLRSGGGDDAHRL